MGRKTYKESCKLSKLSTAFQGSVIHSELLSQMLKKPLSLGHFILQLAVLFTRPELLSAN